MFIVASEPPETAKFNTSLGKRLTGWKKFSSRELFSNQTQINLKGKTIVDSNYELQLQGEINNALLRRLIDYEFPNIFTEDDTKIGTAPPTGGVYKRLNEYYKFREFKDAYKISMMHILLDLFKETKVKVVVPKLIEKSALNICNWNTWCSKMVLW